jgi:hypothetical protein
MKLLVRFSIRLLLLGLFGVTSWLSGFAQGTRYFGMNAGGVADWEEARVFADAMKSSRKWQNLNGTDATLDANGWPTADASIVVHHGVNRFHGTYKLSFTGNGTVVAGMATNVQIVNKVYNAATNTTTADVIETTNDANGLSLTFTGIAGGVKNVKLMRPLSPGSPQSYSVGTLFTDQYKAALARADMIRTMDLSHTNTSDETTWAERILPTNATYYKTRDSYTASTNGQYKNKSCPWEIIVTLANETNKDLWICVPLNADANYVTQLANLIKNGANGYAGLNVNLKLYIEYSNELWNTAPAFQQAIQNWNLAKAEVAAGGSPLNYDGETNDWYWAWRRIGKRTREISNVFKTAFGASQMMTRIRPVLCWQQGAEQLTARQIFTFLENAYPSEKVSDYIFGGGGSAYYSPDFSSTLTASNIWSSGALNVTAWKNTIKKDVAWTAAYGIQYLCYEGGTGFDKCNCPNDPVMQAAWADPQHRQSIVDHQIAFDEMGGFMLGYFTVATYNAREWGFTENIFDLNTQKFNALQDIKAAPKTPLTHGNVAPGSFFPSDFGLTSGWGQPTAGNSLRINSGDYAGYPVRTNTAGTYQIQLEYQYANTGTQLELFLGSASLGTVTLTANAANTLSVTVTGSISLTANTLYGLRVKGKSGSVDLTKINLVATSVPAPPSSSTALITFENLAVGNVGSATYADASGYTLEDFGFASNNLIVSGTAQGYASKCLQNENFQRGIRLRKTNNSLFSLLSLDYAGDQWGGLADATITGFFSNSTTATITISRGVKSYATQAFTWTNLTKVEIDYRGGASENFGVIDNINLGDVVEIIDFENLTTGLQSSGTYLDPKGFTFSHVNAPAEVFQVNGMAQGYASKVFQNQNWNQRIRMTRTGGGNFDLKSLEYASSQWNDNVDARVTGTFANGTTQQMTYTTTTRTLQKLTLNWSGLTAIEIDFTWGSTAAFGVIDNIAVMKAPDGARLGAQASVEPNDRDVLIYPNPTTDILRVNALGQSISRLQVLSGQGQVLIQTTLTNSVDVSKLPSGLYLLQVETQNQKRIAKKFLKL